MEEDISKRPVNTQTILEEIHRIKQAATIPDRRGFPSSIPMKLSQYSPNQQERRGERHAGKTKKKERTKIKSLLLGKCYKTNK